MEWIIVISWPGSSLKVHKFHELESVDLLITSISCKLQNSKHILSGGSKCNEPWRQDTTGTDLIRRMYLVQWLIAFWYVNMSHLRNEFFVSFSSKIDSWWSMSFPLEFPVRACALRQYYCFSFFSELSSRSLHKASSSQRPAAVQDQHPALRAFKCRQVYSYGIAPDGLHQRFIQKNEIDNIQQPLLPSSQHVV